MAKRKVVFVVNHLTVGGVQKSLVSALNAIDYENNEVSLYLRKNRTTLLPFVNENVKTVINNDPNHYYRSLTALILRFRILLRKIIRKNYNVLEERLKEREITGRMDYETKEYFNEEQYDIAIAYSEGYPSVFVGKCVDAERKIMFYQGSTDVLHEIHENTIPLFNDIVVEHEDIKNLLCSWYGDLVEGKIRILDNYCDYKLIRKLGAESYEKKEDGQLVLCTCARFEYVKGIDLAVEAARIMRDKGYDFIWYIVGGGTEEAEVEVLIGKYSLQDRVVLTGILTNPYPYMAGADIYVQPSREEALSIAMLESQILCAPMVSTKTAGGLAMIEDGVNGLLAEIAPESLARAIERMMTDADLRERIKERLSKIDYSSKEIEYHSNWSALLEG